MSSSEPARWDPDTIAQHNAEVKKLWADFEAGCPERVPVAFNLGWRYYLLTPWLNTEGISFQRYFEDPAVQWEVQLTFWKWIREHLPADLEWGLPEQWNGLRPDLQNTYEAAWLGCRMEYRDGEVPDTWPLLGGQDKAGAGVGVAVIDSGIDVSNPMLQDPRPAARRDHGAGDGVLRVLRGAAQARGVLRSSYRQAGNVRWRDRRSVHRGLQSARGDGTVLGHL